MIFSFFSFFKRGNNFWKFRYWKYFGTYFSLSSHARAWKLQKFAKKLFILPIVVSTHVIEQILYLFFFLFSDKPPEEELKQFLEFQLPRQWAPVFSDLPLGPQRKQQSTSSLQFTFMGPKLYVNTSMVKVYFLSTAFLLFLKPLFLEHAHTNLDNMEVRKRYMELSALSCSENGLKPRTMCFPKLQ